MVACTGELAEENKDTGLEARCLHEWDTREVTETGAPAPALKKGKSAETLFPSSMESTMEVNYNSRFGVYLVGYKIRGPIGAPFSTSFWVTDSNMSFLPSLREEC